VTGIDSPAAAHARNASKNRNVNATIDAASTIRRSRALSREPAIVRNATTAVRSASSTVTVMPVLRAGSTQSANWTTSFSLESRKVVAPSRPRTTNRRRATTTKTPSAMVAFQLRISVDSRVSDTGVASGVMAVPVLTWPRPPS
jgi:hypothetical protein